MPNHSKISCPDLASDNFFTPLPMTLTRSDENQHAVARNCEWKRREELLLARYAMFSSKSAGRRYAEEEHPYRSPFQRDRDRVLHCSAFRRLSGKMQVFTGDRGDYHRTRLTHTQEVAMIARTVGRVLRLNEDLIEALALLHDIGHPPFGHSGEDALSECLHEHGGFSHNRFALTVAEELETRYTTYPGLNLTAEVLAGQNFRITHAGETPLLEVQLVDAADSITYNSHDVDDALNLKLIEFRDLQSLDLVQRAMELSQSSRLVGNATAQRQALVHSLIDVQVSDMIHSSLEKLEPLTDLDSVSVCQLGVELSLSPALATERAQLAQFLFDNVYRHEELVKVRKRAAERLRRLYDCLVAHPNYLPNRFVDRAQKVGTERAVGDYLAGMTDRFCDATYRSLIELGETEARDW